MKLKSVLRVSAIALVAGFLPVAAHAVTQTVTANIAFGTPITFGGTPAIQFGTVRALTAETYNIDTAGTVTANTSPTNILYGTTSAASMTISGSTTQAINITANNYQANGNVTPSAAVCRYNAGTAAACSTLTAQTAPGASTALLVGVTVAATAVPIDGATAAPTFDIVVVYN